MGAFIRLNSGIISEGMRRFVKRATIAFVRGWEMCVIALILHRNSIRRSIFAATHARAAAPKNLRSRN